MRPSPSYEVMRILTQVRRLERSILQQVDEERRQELLDELALWLTALQFHRRQESGMNAIDPW